MENIQQLESIIYTNKDNISNHTYIEIMNKMRLIYKDICLLRNIHEDGIQCPHCQQDIDSDDIDIDED